MYGIFCETDQRGVLLNSDWEKTKITSKVLVATSEKSKRREDGKENRLQENETSV